MSNVEREEEKPKQDASPGLSNAATTPEPRYLLLCSQMLSPIRSERRKRHQVPGLHSTLCDHVKRQSSQPEAPMSCAHIVKRPIASQASSRIISRRCESYPRSGAKVECEKPSDLMRLCCNLLAVILIHLASGSLTTFRPQIVMSAMLSSSASSAAVGL